MLLIIVAAPAETKNKIQVQPNFTFDNVYIKIQPYKQSAVKDWQLSKCNISKYRVIIQVSRCFITFTTESELLEQAKYDLNS